MTELPPSQNGWNEWSRYVLKELERLGSVTEGTRNELHSLREEIATARVQTQSDISGLKASATMWGSVGGLVLATIVSIIAQMIVP